MFLQFSASRSCYNGLYRATIILPEIAHLMGHPAMTFEGWNSPPLQSYTPDQGMVTQGFFPLLLPSCYWNPNNGLGLLNGYRENYVSVNNVTEKRLSELFYR